MIVYMSEDDRNSSDQVRTHRYEQLHCKCHLLAQGEEAGATTAATRRTLMSETVTCEEMPVLELMKCSNGEARLHFTWETCGWYLKGSQDFPFWESFSVYIFPFQPLPKTKT